MLLLLPVLTQKHDIDMRESAVEGAAPPRFGQGKLEHKRITVLSRRTLYQRVKSPTGCLGNEMQVEDTIREVHKWKTRINIDGSKQVEGENFWETFSPVATWPTVWLVLIFAL
jgi:hypothetical protein